MGLTSVLRRLQWLKFLYPSQTDLQAEQGSWNTRRQRHLAYDHTTGIVNGLEVTETAPASLSVDVATGRATDPSGDDNQVVAAQVVDLTSFVPGAGTQTVYIVVYFSEVETDPYVVPELGTSQNRYYQEGPVVQAQTAAPAGDVVELARVEVAAAAATIDDAANPDSPTNDEIDQRYRQYQHTRGLGLKVASGAGDSPLSAVTVGDSHCDYKDLPSAISYVNGLTRSETRQVAILVFEKQNGRTWQPGAVLSIPTYTHLIGVGKPTIIFTGIAGNLITLGEGASIENFHVQVDDSWTRVVSLDGDYSRAESVTVRYEHNSVLGNYAFYIDAPGVRVHFCNLFPYSSDATKGCKGVYVNTKVDFLVTGCRLEGDSHLLNLIGSEGSVSDVHVVAHSTTTTAGYIGSSTVTNLWVEVVAGPATVWTFNACHVTGVVIKCSTADDAICDISNATELSGALIDNLRVTLTGSFNTFCNSRVLYGVNDTNAAVTVTGPGNLLTGLWIDRGSRNAPCIAPDANTDECVVTGCRCDNTGTVDSILNDEAGSTNWNLSGNMVDEATIVANGWQVTGELEV